MPVTVGALILLGFIAFAAIVGAVKGGVVLESIGELLGSILIIVVEYILVLGFFVWLIGHLINAW